MTIDCILFCFQRVTRNYRTYYYILLDTFYTLYEIHIWIISYTHCVWIHVDLYYIMNRTQAVRAHAWLLGSIGSRRAGECGKRQVASDKWQRLWCMINRILSIADGIWPLCPVSSSSTSILRWNSAFVARYDTVTTSENGVRK